MQEDADRASPGHLHRADSAENADELENLHDPSGEEFSGTLPIYDWVAAIPPSTYGAPVADSWMMGLRMPPSMLIVE